VLQSVTTAPGEVSKEDDIMGSVKGTIADKMLRDNRDTKQHVEETKEKPDVS